MVEHENKPAHRTWEITCEADNGNVKRETYVVNCSSERIAVQQVIARFRAERMLDNDCPVIVKVSQW